MDGRHAGQASTALPRPRMGRWLTAPRVAAAGAGMALAALAVLVAIGLGGDRGGTAGIAAVDVASVAADGHAVAQQVMAAGVAHALVDPDGERPPVEWQQAVGSFARTMQAVKGADGLPAGDREAWDQAAISGATLITTLETAMSDAAGDPDQLQQAAAAFATGWQEQVLEPAAGRAAASMEQLRTSRGDAARAANRAARLLAVIATALLAVGLSLVVLGLRSARHAARAVRDPAEQAPVAAAEGAQVAAPGDGSDVLDDGPGRDHADAAFDPAPARTSSTLAPGLDPAAQASWEAAHAALLLLVVSEDAASARSVHEAVMASGQLDPDQATRVLEAALRSDDLHALLAAIGRVLGVAARADGRLDEPPSHELLTVVPRALGELVDQLWELGLLADLADGLRRGGIPTEPAACVAALEAICHPEAPQRSRTEAVPDDRPDVDRAA